MVTKTLNKLPKAQVELQVGANWADIEQFWNGTFTRLSQEVELPGFRKGQAPANLVEQHLGSKLQEEFLKDVMPQLLVKILQDEKIVPIDYPKYELTSFAKGGDLSFKATITQRPEVKVGNYKVLLVKKPAPKIISIDDVSRVIEDLHKRWSTRNSSQSSVVSSQTATPPATPSNTAGSIDFSQPATPPAPTSTEPDDNFAKALGAADLQDLKTKIKTDLENEAKNNNELDYEEAILQEVEKITQVDLPEVLVEDELHRMMVSLQRRVADMGLLLEDYLKGQNETVESIRAKWLPQAEKNVRMELGLAQIAQTENVEVTDQEVQAEVDKIQDAKLKAQFEAQEPRLHLKHSLRQVKTLNFLKSLVK